MADNKLEIILSADVDQATKNINAATASIKNLDKAATASKGIDKIGKSAANATPALTNFGRVIQDAPFGIIGIANNIDPLIASFQSLKAQTGSTGGAIKAFVSGLAGPAGIAIAVSAVTSALIAFGPQIANFFNGTKELTEAQKEAAKETKNFADSVSKEIISITALANIVGNENKSRDERLRAIKALRSEYPQYLKDISDEEALTNGVAVAANAATKSIIRRIAIQAATKQLQEEISTALQSAIANEKILAAEDDRLAAKTIEGTSQLNERYSAYLQATTGATGYKKAVGDVRLATESEAKGLSKSEIAATRVFNSIFDVVEKSAAAIVGLGGSVSDFSSRNNESTTKLKDNTKALLKWKEALSFQTPSLTQGIGAGVGASALVEYQALVKGVIAETAKLPPATAIASTQLAQVLKDQQAILTNISNETKAQLEQQAIDKQIGNATNAFNLLTPAIDQAFNALANGENAFEGVKQALKRLLIDLAKAAALSLILSAITGGGCGYGGGFLNIFKGLLGFRANGGPVNAGGPYIVGESGPELFVPSSAGQIVPNMSLGGGGGQLQAVVSGNDLLFILNQAGQNRRNNFG